MVSSQVLPLSIWLFFTVFGKVATSCADVKCSIPVVANGNLTKIFSGTAADYYEYYDDDSDKVSLDEVFDDADEYEPGTEIEIRCHEGYVFKEGDSPIGSISCEVGENCEPHWNDSPDNVCIPGPCRVFDIFGGKITEDCLDGTNKAIATLEVNGTACLRCEDGYVVNENSEPSRHVEVRCLGKNEWDKSLECRSSQGCSKFLRPGNGNIKRYDRHSLIEFSCNPNYRLEGRSLLRCKADGTWDGNRPSCIAIVTCTEPPMIPNAYRTENRNYALAEIVRYECKLGYKTVESSLLTCERGGWVGNLPRCVRVNCGYPERIPNARREGHTFLFGDIVRYHCLEGYERKGSAVNYRLCQPSAKWTSTVMKCEAVRCPAIDPPENGYAQILRGSGNSFGTRYLIGCNHGFKLNITDSKPDSWETRTCSENGSWTGKQLSCEVIRCSPLTTPPDGNLHLLVGKEFNYMSSYSVGCNFGHKLKGHEIDHRIVRVCNSDGKWNDTKEAICQPRKFFWTRREWSSFLATNAARECCALSWGHRWNFDRCPLRYRFRHECLYETCRQEEIYEGYGRGSPRANDVWNALHGVKVSYYENECCWDNRWSSDQYMCYESPYRTLENI